MTLVGSFTDRHGGCLLSEMQGTTLERWQQLCQEAAHEEDPERLMKLVEEINHLLDEKDHRLQEQSRAA